MDVEGFRGGRGGDGWDGIGGQAGSGVVRFQQSYAAGSSSNSNYPFLSSIQGDIAIYQEGGGTTTLNPLVGTGNNYTGGTYISYGTLAYGANNALPTAGDVTMTGGTLQVGTFQGQIAGLLMNPAAPIQFTLNGTGAGQYGQLDVTGSFTAGGHPEPAGRL